MAENTNIEWATHTFNPWEGCQKVGPGCDHCYAEARNARFGGGTATNWGPGAPRRRTSPSNWRKPLQWQAEAKRTGIRPRVFCASLADVFDNAVDPQWRRDLAALIVACRDLEWLLLTKRIGNAEAMLRDMFPHGVPANVWLGITVVNQAEVDRDVETARIVKVRLGISRLFLSIEPMLGPIDIRRHLWPACGWWKGGYRSYDEAKAAGGECGRKPQSLLSEVAAKSLVDWVIAGGESGPNARPVHIEWARGLRDQCAESGTSFLWKQWGEWAPLESEADWERFGPATFPRCQHFTHLDANFARVGKKAAGRLLDGVQHDGVPA